jgi:enoyl-[acyl-carrier protein] reductase I
MGFLAGKKLLITGVLSNRSIAYGIARACRQQGAELAFSYVGERFKERITEFAADFDSRLVFDCDVGDDAQIEKMFADLSQAWPKFDGFVHAIGFAPREAIAGNFLDGMTRENFRIAHDISAYSFPALAKAALPLLNVVAKTSPIRRNVTIEDVGNVAAFLLSDLAGGVTAEITYVDGGFSQTAVAVVDSAA